MTVHQIKIKNDDFEPRTLEVKQGDQIHFQLHGRTDLATVQVKQGQPFEGENAFAVGNEGKAKTISKSTIPQTYSFWAMQGLEPHERARHERVPEEQPGTMTGSIIVVP